MWVLLLVLFLAPSFFLQVLKFSSLHKNQHWKFKFDLEIVDKKSHLMKCLLLNFHLIPIDLFWNKSHYIICCSLKHAFLCFAASTRFVQCDKCNHFFLILSESDSKRYIHVKYNDKASGNEADKQSKAVQAPPPPPRKVCVLLCSSLINP